MTTSLLQGKPLYCREWVFSKIGHCLEHRATAKTCGALIMGGPGCGKTAICCELVWPTVNVPGNRQAALTKRILGYYFCQAHDDETLSVSNFVHCIIDQLMRSDLIPGYREMIADDPIIRDAIRSGDADSALRDGILIPLAMLDPPPSQTLCLLVDSIDESSLDRVTSRDDIGGGIVTVADLLARHHPMFPSWLLLVCSSRKQSKTITRLFTGFRKISLDDLRKPHVVRDVQQYILCRLDRDERLRRHLSRETADALNQLHIKCNGCFLYLEKVLDGVVDNFIRLREIRDIPGTLNGLYLWLCQRLFVNNQFGIVRPILAVILAARRPLTKTELYSCAVTRNTELIYADFETQLNSVSQILHIGRDDTRTLFHHSFAEWLLDVKHCTGKYLTTPAEGHAMLGASFTLHAPSLTPAEVHDFALHVSRSDIGAPFSAKLHAPLWIAVSGASVADCLDRPNDDSHKDMIVNRPKDATVVKLLAAAGARLPAGWQEASLERHSSETKRNPRLCDYVRASCSSSLRETSLQTTATDDSLSISSQPVQYCGIKETNPVSGHESKHQGSKSAVADTVNVLDVDAVDKSGQTALSRAARAGDDDFVRRLISAGASVNHADKDGWTVLRSAAWGGHLSVVRVVLDAGAVVDQADEDGRTALRAAAWGGHDEIVNLLLKRGADVNKVDPEGRTALIAASYMGHADIVRHLLDHGADINHEDIDGRTALSVAALSIPTIEGHQKVVSLLLDRGADVNHCDKDAMTPLLVAAYEGHHSVCELLLEADADADHADNNGRTALQAAASMGHQMVIALLLFWGAAVDMIDIDGRTVLSAAAQQGSVDIVRQLLNRGLDESHRDNCGWTPLHIAAFEGHEEVVHALLEAGARVREVDNDGRIPLILAAQEGHLPVVTTLANSASPLEARGHDGRTALHVAAVEGHEDIVRYLLARGANINSVDSDGRTILYVVALDNRVTMATILIDEGHANLECTDLEKRTPLHVAAWQGHRDIVELLLRRHANPNPVDIERRTPIQSAAWTNRAEVVRVLLEHGAHIDHECSQGATALSISAQEGHKEIIAVLLEYGADVCHCDASGRTPVQVATKSGHSDVVHMLQEYAKATNGIKGNVSGCLANKRAGMADIKYSHVFAGTRVDNNNANMPIVPSPVLKNKPAAMPELRTVVQTLQSIPPPAPRTNTLSTNQSSSSSGGVESHRQMVPLSFTQQLQKCTEPGARRRMETGTKASYVQNRPNSSSPGSERPCAMALSLQSPGSPLSEVNSCKASPAIDSPIYDTVYNGDELEDLEDDQCLDSSSRRCNDERFPTEHVWQQRIQSNNISMARSGRLQCNNSGKNSSDSMEHLQKGSQFSVGQYRMGGMVMGQQMAIMRNSPKTQYQQNGGTNTVGVIPSNTPISVDVSCASAVATVVTNSGGEVIANPGYAPSTPPGVALDSPESLEDTFGTGLVLSKSGTDSSVLAGTPARNGEVGALVTSPSGNALKKETLL